MRIEALDNPQAFEPGTREQAIAYYLVSYAVQETIRCGRGSMGYRQVFTIANRRQTAIDRRLKGGD